MPQPFEDFDLANKTPGLASVHVDVTAQDFDGKLAIVLFGEVHDTERSPPQFAEDVIACKFVRRVR